jgi:hypothetical protein
MNDDNFEQKETKHRRGIFFPLLLLSAGILLLLSNFGMLPGGFWSFVSMYWPVLFILAGLDGLVKGDGIAGSLLIAGFGAVILAGNLGYYSISPWELLLKAWPLLLIGLGLDIIIGKRTFARVVLGLAVTVGLLYGLVNLSGINGINGLSGQDFRQSYNNELDFDLNIDKVSGIVRVSGFTNSTTLMDGTFSQRKKGPISPDIKQTSTGKEIFLTDLAARNVWPMESFGTSDWKIKINPKPSLSLQSKVVVGENQIDVRGLNLQKLEIETSLGRSLVTLDRLQNSEIDIKGAIGEIIVYIPKEQPVRIKLNKALSVSQVPDSFSQEGNEYTSQNFNSSESFTQIAIDLPIGSIQLIEYVP